jgi:hypothetical protein
MGLTWAVAHFGVGVVVALVNWQFGVDAFGNGLAWVAYNSLLSAATGFVGGTAFSVVLGIAEGRRRFDQMSLPRFAIWGAVGGAVVAGALTVTSRWGTPSLLANLGILSLLGAGCAAGSLALARVSDDRELLDASAEAADVGLTEGEVKELLAGRG